MLLVNALMIWMAGGGGRVEANIKRKSGKCFLCVCLSVRVSVYLSAGYWDVLSVWVSVLALLNQNLAHHKIASPKRILTIQKHYNSHLFVKYTCNHFQSAGTT
jgi:hypothetical protein